MSKYRKAILEKPKEKALKLYKKGMTTREVGKILGKSHSWVAEVVKKVPKV